MSNDSDNYGYGYTPPEEKTPEDEFFHSIYIGGNERKNHIGIVEKAGSLHIRGVNYNLNEVCFIITHVKPMLVKYEKINNQKRTVCFSYQNTNPWMGSSGNVCPANRADREASSTCIGCRGEIVIAGLLCEKNGKPILKDKKPIFVFVRGRGIKSPSVYKYLEDISKIDLPAIFPDNPSLENRVVKNKRYVTVVRKTTTGSKYGTKNTFDLNFGQQIDDKVIQKILKIQKETIPQFNEKFDWSSKIKNAPIKEKEDATTDHDGQSDQESQQEPVTQEPAQQESASNTDDGYDFGDIPF